MTFWYLPRRVVASVCRHSPCVRGCARLRGAYAPRWGFVDRPGGHKGHRAPTPLGGGVAIWLTTVISCSPRAVLALLAAGEAGLARAAGAARRRDRLPFGRADADSCAGQRHHGDGTRGRRPKPRLAAAAGHPVRRAPACWHGPASAITLFGPFTHPLLGGTVTVLWIVGLTNAFNMLDNMDGLAASVGLIAALLFCGAQVAVGSSVRAGGPAGRGGGPGGFSGAQPWRRRGCSWGTPAATSSGSCSGALTVVGTFTRDEQGGSFSRYGVLAPLLVMAVPLYDMVSVV